MRTAENSARVKIFLLQEKDILYFSFLKKRNTKTLRSHSIIFLVIRKICSHFLDKKYFLLLVFFSCSKKATFYSVLLLLLLFWSRLRVMACFHSQGEAPFLFCFLYTFSSIAYLHSAYIFCLPAAPWYKRHIPLSIFFIVLPILFYTQFFEKQTKL